VFIGKASLYRLELPASATGSVSYFSWFNKNDKFADIIMSLYACDLLIKFFNHMNHSHDSSINILPSEGASPLHIHTSCR